MTTSDTNADILLFYEDFGNVLFAGPSSPWELDAEIRKSSLIRKQPIYILFSSKLFPFPQIHPRNS